MYYVITNASDFRRGGRDKVKKKYFIFATIIALLLTSVLLYGCQENGTVTGISSSQQTGIWVTGQGKVTVTPDLAIIQVGIQAQGKSVADAQLQATTAMTDVMSALTANGIAAKDIQTQYFNIQQLTRWDNDKQEQVVYGYQVTNMVTVKIRDLTKPGTIIDAVALAGGDLIRVNSIQFTVEDPTVYYDEAREKAMADAQDTATQLASLSDVKLGKPIFISVSGSSSPQAPTYFDQSVKEAGSSTPISSGELEISLTVQVTYAIK
jgi:uncharacterized protein